MPKKNEKVVETKSETPAPEPEPVSAPRPPKKAPAGFNRWTVAPGVTGIATKDGSFEVVNGIIDLPEGFYPEGLGITYFPIPEAE